MLQLFLRHLSKKGKSPNTIRQYESNLTKFFREYPEDPSKITMTMVDSIRKRYTSRSTVHAHLACIRSYLLFAQSEGKKTIDIAKIYLPGIEPTKIVALTKDQIDAMIEHAQDLTTRALIAFLFSTGLRISEALHLKRTDLKPEMQIIGKRGKLHTVFLSDSATKHMSSYIHSRTDKNNALWVSSEGTAMNYIYAYRAIWQAGVDAHIPFPVTPHVIRHSIATYLMEQWVDSRYIQEFLAHGSITTTMRYAHVTPVKLRSIHKEILQ